MRQILKEYLQDCSTKKYFQFFICCEVCGRIWKSNLVCFSKSGAEEITKEKEIVYRALYEREKKSAYEKALKEAIEIFSRCPICGRLICDHCFMICNELDMCCECAGLLNESGSLVKEYENKSMERRMLSGVN